MLVDIRKDFKRYAPIFQQAADQGMNEADTSLRLGKFFEEVLGYDMFLDISKEYTVKDRFVDYAIKINGKTTFFVEVKQAGNYAANAGVEWVILTNGTCWHLYHLTFEDGIQSDLIFSVDVSKEPIDDAATKLSLLHKKSVEKGEHLDYFNKIKTLEPKNIMQCIFHEETLCSIRKQLKKMTGVRIEEEALVSGIKQMISPDTWEKIGDIKVKRQRKMTKSKKEAVPSDVEAVQPLENNTGEITNSFEEKKKNI